MDSLQTRERLTKVFIYVHFFFSIIIRLLNLLADLPLSIINKTCMHCSLNINSVEVLFCINWVTRIITCWSSGPLQKPLFLFYLQVFSTFFQDEMNHYNKLIPLSIMMMMHVHCCIWVHKHCICLYLCIYQTPCPLLECICWSSYWTIWSHNLC